MLHEISNNFGYRLFVLGAESRFLKSLFGRVTMLSHFNKFLILTSASAVFFISTASAQAGLFPPRRVLTSNGQTDSCTVGMDASSFLTPAYATMGESGQCEGTPEPITGYVQNSAVALQFEESVWYSFNDDPGFNGTCAIGQPQTAAQVFSQINEMNKRIFVQNYNSQTCPEVHSLQDGQALPGCEAIPNIYRFGFNLLYGHHRGYDAAQLNAQGGGCPAGDQQCIDDLADTFTVTICHMFETDNNQSSPTYGQILCKFPDVYWAFFAMAFIDQSWQQYPISPIVTTLLTEAYGSVPAMAPSPSDFFYYDYNTSRFPNVDAYLLASANGPLGTGPYVIGSPLDNYIYNHVLKRLTGMF
ncbi:MAG: hypothetical protein H6619_02875 [Deltaproteobacteria bacterium]|nr:hypothetical protein [Deltaproteobacteria bacterium]